MIASRPSRPRHGGARLVAATALFAGVAAIAMSACSAGQITQTGSQVAAVPGANANAGPNGQIALRNLFVQYNNPDGYAKGQNAPLVVRIFNGLLVPVSVVSASAPDYAASVTLVEATPAAPPAASPGPGGTASPGPTTPASPPAGGTQLAIKIAPGSYALLVPGKGPYLQLTGLTKALAPGYSVPVTFTFSDGSTVTVTMPFGLPLAPAPLPSPVVSPGDVVSPED